MATADLTAARLRELLDYDPITGIFTNRITRGSRAKAGDVAGSVTAYGYLTIRIDRVAHQAHRLAWLYVHGALPAGDIDHRDGDGFNNAILNLRDVAHEVNTQNIREPHADSGTGFLGVWRKRGRWTAGLCVRGRRVCLGMHHTAEQAHAAYVAAKRRLHEGCTI